MVLHLFLYKIYSIYLNKNVECSASNVQGVPLKILPYHVLFNYQR